MNEICGVINKFLYMRYEIQQEFMRKDTKKVSTNNGRVKLSCLRPLHSNNKYVNNSARKKLEFVTRKTIKCQLVAAIRLKVGKTIHTNSLARQYLS